MNDIKKPSGIALIGAGLPRTGTLTQKLALEELGLEPCYHWVNVIADLDQVGLWDRALDGEAPWEEIFNDHRSTADWPGGYFYRELMDFYPEAKVLLSVREPESWERSFRQTIWTMCHGETLMPLLSRARAQVDPRWQRYLALVDRMFWGSQGTFAAGHADPAQLIAQMLEHNEEVKRVVPFLKVDLGLADEANDVQLMKPIDTLDDELGRAQQHRIFGTKMRSFIKDANQAGISAIVDQQFEYAERIRAAGLVPIMEPEVSIKSPHKEQAETLLRDAIHERLAALPADAVVMFKVSIPNEPGLYGSVASDPRVLRVLALSGGYSRDEACALLAQDPTLTASFSRALLQGLTAGQTDEQFHAELEASIAEIYKASARRELA